MQGGKGGRAGKETSVIEGGAQEDTHDCWLKGARRKVLVRGSSRKIGRRQKILDGRNEH